MDSMNNSVARLWLQVKEWATTPAIIIPRQVLRSETVQICIPVTPSDTVQGLACGGVGGGVGSGIDELVGVFCIY